MTNDPKYATVARLSVLTIGLLAGSASADIFYRTVALEGQAAPGGGTFHDFEAPTIGPEGSIAVIGEVMGVPAGTGARVLLERDGVLSLLTTSGAPAPGTAGGVTFSPALLTQTTACFTQGGALFFSTTLQGAGVSSSNNSGVWLENHSPLELLVREGDDLAPLLPMTALGNLSPFVAVDADRMIFRTQLAPEPGGTEGRAIFLVEDGVVSEVLREDAQAPTLPAGVLNSGVPLTFAVGASGEFMGFSILTGAGVNSGNDGVLWGGTVDAPEVLLREGDPVPIGGGETTFQRFDAVALSAGGVRAVEVQTQGGGPSALTIWVFEDDGTPTFVMNTETTPVPGAGPDVSFGTINLLGVDDAGVAVFSATLNGPDVTGGDNSAIFRMSADGEATLVAREGDPAPGTGGALFADLSSPVLFVSALGQIVLERTVTGPGVNNSNDRALWMTDAAGDLQLVVREGDLFDIDDDPGTTDLRTVQGVFFGGSTPSDNGEIAFSLTYEPSNTGVFVVQIDPPGASGSCPGDADGDDAVDLADLNLVLANFGGGAGGDVTGDGLTDLVDLNLVLANFGTVCG